MLLAEVTSPSTEEYDQGEKLRHYMPSLREVLLLSHRQPRVTLHTRAGDAWVALTAKRSERIQTESLHASAAVDALYEDALEDAP